MRARDAWAVVALSCLACGPRSRPAAPVEISPADRILQEEDRRGRASRAMPADELPKAPPPLFVVARSRNVPFRFVAGNVGGPGGAGAPGVLVGDRLVLLEKGPLQILRGVSAPAQPNLPLPSRPTYCWDRLVSSSAGSRLAVGVHCGTHALAAEHFAPHAPVGDVENLPGVDWAEQAGATLGPVVSGRDGSFFVAASYVDKAGVARPYLAVRDGGGWTSPPVPQRQPEITFLAPTPDGPLLLTESRGADLPHGALRQTELWRRDGAGTWHRVAMPTPALARVPVHPKFIYRESNRRYEDMASAQTTLEPAFAWVSAGDPSDLWIGARWEDGEDEHWVLLRSHAGQEVVDFGDAPPAPPASKVATRCAGTYYVSLGGVPGGDPRSRGTYDFLSVRAVLLGHPEVEGVELVETVSAGRLVHGVFTRDPRVAERLLFLLAKLPGRPTLEVVCAAPRAIRVAPMDIATGDLRG